MAAFPDFSFTKVKTKAQVLVSRESEMWRLVPTWEVSALIRRFRVKDGTLRVVRVIRPRERMARSAQRLVSGAVTHANRQDGSREARESWVRNCLAESF